MESTSQAVATQPSAPSAMPTYAEPQQVAPSGMSSSPTSQASPMPQLNLAQHPAYQASAPAAQASAPAGNPWQEAFQALSASLNTSSPSQAPAQYSAYQTPTPQANTQAAWASQAAPTQAQYSQQQTYSPQASTQAYSEGEVRQLLAEQAQNLSASASDGYLSQISDESLEVLEHFGAEAPQLLNTYACAVEDALIEQVQRGQSQALMLEAAGEERAAMNLMLTDPDVLADYVNDFYGPNGPYPTPTESEAREIAEMEARAQFESEIEAQERNIVPPSFQRPAMDMPTPGRQVNAANDFWGGFSQIMDNNPEDAWKFLSQAPGAAFQSKMLVQDT